MGTNELGFNLLEHCNLDLLLKYIDDCKIINLKLNNFYLGMKCQRNYDLILATAWQTAEPVLENKIFCKKIGYIIQDLEYLFYHNDENLKIKIINTYHKDFYYYCLSKYLFEYFKKKNSNVYESILGYDKKHYYDMYLERKNSVIITFYDYKIGRLPHLVKKIVKILSDNKILCYIFPCKFNFESEYVKFIGNKSINELNKLYNSSKVGIVFSSTNPSRIGFEMFGSGLNVIEYKSEFTKLDMPDNHFKKINDEKMIVEITKNIFKNFNKNDDNYKNKICVEKEYNYFIKYIKNILKN